MDTAYGYDMLIGSFACSADELHRHITGAVGEWLDRQGIDWAAHNNVTGEWAKRPMPS